VRKVIIIITVQNLEVQAEAMLITHMVRTMSGKTVSPAPKTKVIAVAELITPAGRDFKAPRVLVVVLAVWVAKATPTHATGNFTRGAGGAGRTNVITGTSVTYAQGGGNGTVGGSRGNNTGDGGNNNQYGNSGIVVLRWSTEYRAALNTTGSPTYSINGDYHIYQFTASGSIVF